MPAQLGKQHALQALEVVLDNWHARDTAVDGILYRAGYGEDTPLPEYYAAYDALMAEVEGLAADLTKLVKEWRI